jgi:uncharacterized protein (TIGR03032 family)
VTNLSENSGEAIASVHTKNFPGLLHRLQSSLLVTTTEKANMLIVVRAEGEALHTDFVTLTWPTGIAVHDSRLLIGSRDRIYDFRNMPTFVMDQTSLAGRDAVYLIRNIHVTGAINMHEMAFVGEECWGVATRFSCLCTFDQEHSFVPRWRPRFISGYSPGDRCHMNGLALQGGRPKFVTALGESNEVEGWRANRRDGGVLLDVDSGETVVRGLSMPHSPRWYRDRLWLLESGKGSLATVDLATGKVETLVRLPGVTRGLDFFDKFAFVGLSKVRASNMWVDLPLTEENPDRASGVWIVNIETGRTVAFLRFSDIVDEIFAVHLMRGKRYPHVGANDAIALETSWVLPQVAMKDVELATPTASAVADAATLANRVA